MQNGTMEVEKQDLAAVFDQANQLNHAGYQLTIMKNYEKKPIHTNWQNIYSQPEPGMTAVGIVGGSVIRGTNRYIYIVDIDIYRPEKRDKVFNEIMSFFGLSEVYVEKSPSGGYHIIFTSEGEISSKISFKFHAHNDSAKIKDKVEFFASGQVLVAPSWAINKDGNIGKYEKISDVDIFDSAVLSADDLDNFMDQLKRLSEKYRGSTYHHNHITTPEHRSELVQEYHHLKAMGYTCAPLTGGNKHRNILSWEKISEKDFETNQLTGIVLKLGKQLNGSYLNCLDFDDPSDEVIEILFGYNSANIFLEKSVSGGFHILFLTKGPLDIYGNRLLAGGSGKVEVLWTEHQTVNIAPTCSYIKGYAYSGAPEYRISRRLSGSFENIGYADTIKMRASLNRLAQNRRKDTGAPSKQFETISEENKMALQYIHQYGKLDEIDKQIRLVYPSNTDLLNSLNIKHLGNPKPDYIRFFSLCADDGDNPDALLFHNINNNQNNPWAGYSVKDHHSGEVISFSKYLRKYAPPKFDRLMQKIGFGKASIKIPIETTFSGKTVEIKCDRYITEAQYMEVLNHIQAIRSSKGKRQARIVITAPTGIGKTSMFYHLAKTEKIKVILMLSYTSQVLQGKERISIPGVMEGLCESDYRVPETGSIFGTYDKASIMYKSIDPREFDFVVVDEAHNLVNQSIFRSPAMKGLNILLGQSKAEIYMTATPDYINFKNIDLLIKISMDNPSTKSGTVVKYNNDSKSILCNVITNQHIPGNIDIVYARDIKKLETIQHVISTKFSGIETHMLYADLKNDSKVYDNLSEAPDADGRGGISNRRNFIHHQPDR